MELLPTINAWVANMGHLILAINLVMCWQLRDRLPAFFLWFTCYLLTGLVIQLVAKVLWYQSMNNLPLLHLYTLLEFILLSFFYRPLLSDRKLKYFPHFVWVTALLILLNSLFIQSIYEFNTIAKTGTHVIFIGYALRYAFGLHKQEQVVVKRVNNAILIYYSASLFIFMFTNVWFFLKDLYRYFWLANVFFYLFFQLSLFYALWKTGRQQMKSSP